MFISYRTMATLMLCLVASVAHAADAPACDLAGPARTVTRIAQLPPEVQSLLLENGPVSDPGSPFNASDVFIVDDPTSGQRLVSGQAGPDAICLWLEHGAAAITMSFCSSSWSVNIGRWLAGPTGRRSCTADAAGGQGSRC
jgi:hypothetical protein